MFISNTSRRFLVARSSLVTQKRTNIREQLSRYHEPEKFKKHMLAACEPYYKPSFLLPEEKCKLKPPKEIPIHPLDIMFAKELLKEIKNSDTVLFIQYNYTPFQSERVYKNTITKLGGKFHALNNRIYKIAFTELDRPEVQDLFVTRNAIVTGDSTNLPRWVKAIHKMPQFLLLAGSIDGQLFSRSTLELISEETSLDRLRAKLSLTLSASGQQLTSILR